MEIRLVADITTSLPSGYSMSLPHKKHKDSLFLPYQEKTMKNLHLK